MVAVHAHLLGQLAVDLEHALLTMEGDEETGLRQRVDDLQLLLAGVAGDVEHIGLVVNDLHALAEQFVDDPAHRHLVAGDGGGGENHLVAGADLHLLVGGKGHAVQRAHLLALGAGGDDDLLVPGEVFDLVDVHQRVLGHLHIPQLRGDLHDVLHGPARDSHFPPAGGGGGEDLLDAVDVGGKGGDDDALVAVLELPHKRLAHGAFAHGVAGALHIGGVSAKAENALLAQLAQTGKVDDLAVDRGGVDLKVAGVEDGAHLGVDGEGHGVRDRVVHVDELHSELARPDGLAGVHSDDLGGFHQVVFLQLELNEPCGEAGAVDGHVHLLEDVGDGTHVVLVAVGDEKATDAGLILNEVGDIGDDAVDAVHVVAGEGHAAVHHDDLAAVFVGGHVFADLVETAKRDDLQFFSHKY